MATGASGEYPHLPAGRAPGSQSRRRRTATGCLSVAMPVAAVLFLLVMGPVAVLSGDPRFYVAAALGAGTFGAAGVALRRRRRPRLAEHIGVSTASDTVRRGEEVAVRLEIADLDRVAEHLELGLVCTVWYDRYERVGRGTDSRPSRIINERTAYEEWRSVSPGQRVQSVSFQVPANAPFSHEGSCLSFAWRVSAREPAAMRADPVRDHALWVSP